MSYAEGVYRNQRYDVAISCLQCHREQRSDVAASCNWHTMVVLNNEIANL